MNLMITSNAKMNSREISDITGKRHDNVKRTIETLLQKDVISNPQFEDGEKSGNGITEKVYVFCGDHGKRDSIIVVAQLCPEFTARLVDRWVELEQQLNPLPDFTDPAAAAIAWAEQFRAKQSLEHDVSRLQNTCNRLADQFAIGLTLPQFAAQLNGVNTQKVNDFLFKMGWVYKEADEWRVAAYARDKYLKQEFLNKPIREGITRLCSKLTLTRRGAKQFYKYYTDQKLPMKTTWDGNLTHITFEKVA